MEDTCKFSNCVIAKRLKIKTLKECPNHFDSSWTDNDGNVLITNDCAPVRTVIMVRQLYGRLIGVEQSQEKQRKDMQPLKELLAEAKDYNHYQKALT